MAIYRKMGTRGIQLHQSLGALYVTRWAVNDQHCEAGRDPGPTYISTHHSVG